MVEKITKELVKNWIPKRQPESYKGSFKKILCIGGNQQMGGAILLASSAALHAGAGLVTVATCSDNLSALHARCPECLFVDMYNFEELEKAISENEVILLGPGLGRDEKSQSVYELVVEQIDSQQLILDADGLYWLSQLRSDFSSYKFPPVLTPHLGEWQRLTEITPPANEIKLNVKAQEQLNTYIVLKKHRTEIYGFQEIWQNTTGNPSMATGGMGDVLAGIIASLISQNNDIKAAILSAVYLHSYTADDMAKNQYITLPSQIIEKLPFIMKQFTE